MASTILQFLARFAHPVYPQRTAIINAYTLDQAVAYANATVAGTCWTVVSVTLFSPPT